jgi:hypothetical protein
MANVNLGADGDSNEREVGGDDTVSDRALIMSDAVNLPDKTTLTRGFPAAH